MCGAFYTGEYENWFLRLGYSEEEVSRKIEQTFLTLFYGAEEERIYHPVGSDMGHIEDTGNHDVRTEGMSYGMMMCVQMNRRDEFDRIWKWAKTYMYMESGENAGYFAWSCATDGTKNSYGPAPDGEEFFAMALFSPRHAGETEREYTHIPGRPGRSFMTAFIREKSRGQAGQCGIRKTVSIRFIPDCEFTDPSYHLPHFYELFALWADEEDRTFWKKAAEASRRYLRKACHPLTGLSAEYADYDGKPYTRDKERFGRHDWYYSDAYRTIANIGLDYIWFGPHEWERETANRLQRFYSEDAGGRLDGVYLTDGTPVDQRALHPTAVAAVNAQASLAADGPYAKEWVRRFWETPLRTGGRRYYDNCLYFFALLALGGEYRIWKRET